jgi:hypothetical protein
MARHEGKYLEFSVGGDAGCGLGRFRLWTTRSDWMKPAAHLGGTVFTAERPNYRVWILDVSGVRYLVAALSAADATDADRAELQGVIDSVALSATDEG